MGWVEVREDGSRKHIFHNNTRRTIPIRYSTDGFYQITGILLFVNQLPAASVSTSVSFKSNRLSCLDQRGPIL